MARARKKRPEGDRSAYQADFVGKAVGTAHPLARTPVRREDGDEATDGKKPEVWQLTKRGRLPGAPGSPLRPRDAPSPRGLRPPRPARSPK